nr:MAG TPA: NYN ribonuclease and ATPase [Caudoviricetes sp.]
MKTYIIDTNIILDSLENLFKLYNSENKIVICDTVIDEVDSKKSGLDELGYRAREFARFLDSLSIDSVETDNDITITKLSNKSIKLELFSKSEYAADSKYAKSPAILADRKIIECCKYYESGILVSLDTMCRLRAICESIDVETLGNQDSDINYRFDKMINFDKPFENQCIFEIDPEHKQNNYNYLISETCGNKLLCRVVNESIKIVDEKNLMKQDVSPKNIGQKFFVDSILDPQINLIAVSALAGSGKSLLAIATAMRLVNEKKFNKIVYIRNSIESLDRGEDIGYLAGNDEKFAVYNHPLYDSLSFIAQKQLEKSNNNKSKKTEIKPENLEERVNELIKRYNIETMWVGELRGRTISKAVVIWDEAQNASKKTGLLILSRLDKDCKIIITGSNAQIDNAYTNKYVNALTTILKAGFEKHKEINMTCVNLDKMIRGPITAFAERVFKL